MRKIKKEIMYKVRTIKPGQIFGHEEFIMRDDFNNPDIKREYRVTCTVHSEVIYAHKSDF